MYYALLASTYKNGKGQLLRVQTLKREEEGRKRRGTSKNSITLTPSGSK